MNGLKPVKRGIATVSAKQRPIIGGHVHADSGILGNMPAKSKTKAEFKPVRYTRKERAFIKELIDNPKQSATEAASKVYNVKNRNSARALATQTMNKPKIIMALGEHNDLFESVIVGTARDWQHADAPRKREIALNAAMYGHDKVHGKATVKMEQQVSVVRIAINLAGDGEQPPEDLIEQPA